jgi:hydrogenase maturation protein HypF
MVERQDKLGRGGVAGRGRLEVVVRGAVQGVGFRPFIYRLATSLGLTGWVSNGMAGVVIEVEGREADLQGFLCRLPREKPERASISSLESRFLDPLGYREFEIRSSVAEGEPLTVVLPDIATCPECLAEMRDPANRRYGYPFTNCTNCGPRYTIIEALPYDRGATTMCGFEMCPACRAEYLDPTDRRFHAQPNCCPACGPQLQLLDEKGEALAVREAALEMAVEALRAGSILAVKGIGGFHLMVDAANDRAVAELRRRKHREEKPLAMLYPLGLDGGEVDWLAEVRRDCAVSMVEERLLLSAEAPIVLLERHARQAPGAPDAARLAPGTATFGIMLPSNPLHHLLMERIGRPLVATSGNLSAEPICIDNEEVLARLAGIADLFLVHDRPIRRRVDDSIVRVMAGREMVLRRARGYAPLPIEIGGEMPPLLATGAHLKNTVALARGSEVIISQHLGDLETAEAVQAFVGTIETLEDLYRIAPVLIAHDVHPDYASTRYATSGDRPGLAVPHHYAHVLSCMAENRVAPPVLGVAWDGSGLGADGTLWGGEFLRIDEAGYERVAHWRSFPLPGGESAIREPRRTAMGLLHEIFGPALFDQAPLAALPQAEFMPREREVLAAMLARRLNSPRTSSVGRLFDAVAALLGIRQRVHFEGQAAMELEYALDGVETNDSYPLQVIMEAEPDPVRHLRRRSGARTLILDWEPMIREIIRDLAHGVTIAFLAAKFHNTLVESLVTVAGLVGEPRVCLSGGCFQNRYLMERSIARLREEGLQVYWHQRVPPNDGGIALGQVVAAVRYLKEVEAPAPLLSTWR